MSQEIVNVYQKSYDQIVKHEYQGTMKLRGAVRLANNVVGNTHDFRIVGKGIANERGPLSSDVVPMNLDYNKETATLTDWNAPEYSDVFSTPKVNFDEVSLAAKASAMAIGRRMDQLIIDAMDTGANSTQVSTDEGGTGTGLNVAKIRAAAALLDDNEVPEDDRYFIAHYNGKKTLLAETETTSSDFMTVKNLVNGSLDTFYGFKFIWLGTRAEGGLAKSSNIRTNFAIHGGQMGSVGLAIGMDITTALDWIPQKTSTLINTKMSAGSVVIDDEGVYEVLTTES